MAIYYFLMNILVMPHFLIILSVDLNNINLDDTNYDEDDSETIIHIGRLAWHVKLKKNAKQEL